MGIETGALAITHRPRNVSAQGPAPRSARAPGPLRSPATVYPPRNCRKPIAAWRAVPPACGSQRGLQPRTPTSRSMDGLCARTVMRCGRVASDAFASSMRDVGGIADRPAGPNGGERNPGSAPDPRRHEVETRGQRDDRDVLMLHLAPPPGHAFPEPQLWIVIAHAVVAEADAAHRRPKSVPPRAPDREQARRYPDRHPPAP